MAMLTKALIAEFRARIERGEHINSTVHEEDQLVHAWERRSADTEYAGQCRALADKALPLATELAKQGYVYDAGKFLAAVEGARDWLEEYVALAKGSDGGEVRSPVVGGAQCTQGGGDSTGMPLSVGRSRPDQTATSPVEPLTGSQHDSPLGMTEDEIFDAIRDVYESAWAWPAKVQAIRDLFVAPRVEGRS